MEQEKIKCLYYIKDNRTDKIIYIGQTKDFKQRRNEHFRKNQNPIDLYMFEEGRDNFSMEKFDIDCTDMSGDEILQKEDELILQYDTINNGLNKRRSGWITKTEDYLNFKCRRYRENNKAHCKEQLRLYYLEHKKQYIENCKQYRARKKQEKLANETN